MPFSTFGLHPDILRGVKDLGFSQPTPIQKDAIPAGLSGRDVLACAATGSGKTAAFGLPILNFLMGRSRGKSRVLIITPTRELAAQIDEHLGELGQHTQIKSAAVYGGVGMGAQQQALRKGVDIIVATPGRLLDHIRNHSAKLQSIEVLVLDEADRMLDMGFLPDIKSILQQLPKQKQTLFFSATMPNEIKSLTQNLLVNPVTINIEREARPASGITQTIYPVPHLRKQALLLKLVQSENLTNALAFTRTKRRADRVAEFLKRNGVSATRIHGDRTQGQREQALDGFKRGKYQVLVATDVAARGIDIDALSHVINVDFPGSTEDYIHRVGRTARAEAKGDAFTFVAPDEMGDLKAIERALKTELPRVTLPDFDYTVEEVPPGQWRSNNRGNDHNRRREQRGPQARNTTHERHASHNRGPAGEQPARPPQPGRRPRPWEKNAWGKPKKTWNANAR